MLIKPVLGTRKITKSFVRPPSVSVIRIVHSLFVCCAASIQSPLKRPLATVHVLLCIVTSYGVRLCGACVRASVSHAVASVQRTESTQSFELLVCAYRVCASRVCVLLWWWEISKTTDAVREDEATPVLQTTDQWQTINATHVQCGWGGASYPNVCTVATSVASHFPYTACYSRGARQWSDRDFVWFVYVSCDFGCYVLLAKFSSKNAIRLLVRHGRISVWLLFESLDGCSGSETANACRARRDEMSVVCVWRTIEIVRDCEKTIIIIRLASEARRRRKKNCHKSHAQQFCTYSGRYMYDEMGITTRTNQRAIFFLLLLVRSFVHVPSSLRLWLTPVEFEVKT